MNPTPEVPISTADHLPIKISRRQFGKLLITAAASAALAKFTGKLDAAMGPLTTISKENIIIAKHLPRLIKDYLGILKSQDPNKEAQKLEKEKTIVNWILAHAVVGQFEQRISASFQNDDSLFRSQRPKCRYKQ